LCLLSLLALADRDLWQVRLAYKDPLLEAHESLLRKSEDHARQLAELKLEREEVPELRMGGFPRGAAVPNTEDQAKETTLADHSGYIWPKTPVRQ
jgi:hypothetical protein